MFFGMFIIAATVYGLGVVATVDDQGKINFAWPVDAAKTFINWIKN